MMKAVKNSDLSKQHHAYFMMQCTIWWRAVGITRSMTGEQYLASVTLPLEGCCPWNRRSAYAGSVCRRNAELHEFPRSLQSILTDAVPCYLGQEPTKKYGWTALSIFATAVPSDTLSNRLRHHCQSLHRVKRTSQLLCWLLLLAPSESTLGKDCSQNVGALVLF